MVGKADLVNSIVNRVEGTNLSKNAAYSSLSVAGEAGRGGWVADG